MRALAVLIFSVLGACSEQGLGVRWESSATWRPVHRFAPMQPGSTGGTATIGDQTRPALRADSPVTLNYSRRTVVPGDGQVTLRPRLPEGVVGERVLLEVRVRPGDRWRTLEGRLLEPYFLRGPRVEVAIDLRAEGFPDSVGKLIGVWVAARAPQYGEDVITSSEFVVPARARLDFAIGIAETAQGLGPVDFEISACERSRARACEVVFEQKVDPSRPGQRGWLDQSVSLAAYADRAIQLDFKTTALASSEEGPGYSLPFWGDPTLLEPLPRLASSDSNESGGSPGPEPNSPTPAPNLILLSLDTLRAGHMSAYGYARETTPFIRELAGSGTLFEQYVAAASSTRPSHMTMFTSLPPSVHGATESDGSRSLPPGAITLAERLRESGFATGAVTENGAIDRSRGFGRGFGVYVEHRGSTSADLREGQISETFESGLAWLELIRGQRFFLFLHTYQVHNPFTPPPDYNRLFTEQAPELEAPADLRRDWDPVLYDREIRYTDDRVRELFAALEEGGFLKNTIFVLTSDHGEAFLEHGFMAHGANVHKEVLDVPLLLVGPGVAAGRRIDVPVSMVDLMPTLLEMMRVEPSGQEMGQSQAARIRDDGLSQALALRPVFGEAWDTRALRARGQETILQPTLSIQMEGLKLIRSRQQAGFRYELYDVARDPREEVNLYAREPQAAAKLRERLERRVERMAARYEDLSRESVRDAPPVDPGLEDKLRALGYIE
jgi:arylsulfatase A-like enzyme